MSDYTTATLLPLDTPDPNEGHIMTWTETETPAVDLTPIHETIKAAWARIDYKGAIHLKMSRRTHQLMWPLIEQQDWNTIFGALLTYVDAMPDYQVLIYGVADVDKTWVQLEPTKAGEG